MKSIHKKPNMVSKLLASVFLMLVLVFICNLWKQWQRIMLDHLLIGAIKRHSASDVNIFLRSGANPNARISSWSLAADTGDECAIVEAANAEASNIVKILLDNGANVNTSNPHTHVTALMVTAEKGDTTTMQLLLANGANINAINVNKWTALDYAWRSDKQAAVNLLVRHGALKGSQVNIWGS